MTVNSVTGEIKSAETREKLLIASLICSCIATGLFVGVLAGASGWLLAVAWPLMFASFGFTVVERCSRNST